MKILRIIYDWPKPWQGLAPHPYEVTIAQQKRGHEVEIMCGSWPKSGGPEKPNNAKVHPIFREPLPGTIFFTSCVLLFLRYFPWRKLNKVDIIHSHGHFGIWIYWYRSILQKHFPWAKELKTPLVVHFHNVAKSRAEALEEQGLEITPKTKYISIPMEVFSNKLAFKTAAACIFVGKENMDYAIKNYKLDQNRCFLVETGVNTDLFNPIGSEEKENSRWELGLDMYDKVVLNHGIMSERKNIHLLIEAMKFLPDHYKLLLVGPTDPVYAQKLITQIKLLKLGERVIRVGYTPYPQTHIAYQVSDVFVLPSGWEGLPKAVMQGLACNIPCLVSGFKLSEELQGLVYIKENNPKVIAEQIAQIVENPMSVNIDKLSNKYSWDKRVEEIDKIYAYAKQYYLL